MRRILRWLAVVSFLAASFAAHAADAFEHGLLWRIDRPSERSTLAPSYVFGTLHLSDERVARIPSAASDAIIGAQSVVTEVVFEPAALRRVSARLRERDGTPLVERLGSRDFERLVAALGEDGVQRRTIERLTAFGALTHLTVRPARRGATLDLAIAQLAADREIAVGGLETVDEQMLAIDSLDDAAVLAELRAALADLRAFRAYVESLVTAYRSESIGMLYRLAREGAPWRDEPPKQIANDPLIEGRNERMAERMQTWLAEGGAFVAIGAAHLAGEGGVLARLARAGWRVERVPLR